MNIKYCAQIFVIAMFISACSAEVAAPDAADSVPGPVVAKVDGRTITAPMLEVFARGRGLNPDEPVARQRALDALIETMLLAQDAEARGLTDRPDIQAELALVRLQQLAGRGMSELRDAQPVTDAEVQAYYERESARTGHVELHLKHILFGDEAAAMAMVERALAQDTDFDALMVDSGNFGARQARDLGWANLTQLPPELAVAANTISDGQVAPLPVQTSFGWHVYKREASRAFAPPPLEQVAEGARRQLAEKRLAEQVQALRSKARIELSAGELAGPGPAPSD